MLTSRLLLAALLLTTLATLPSPADGTFGGSLGAYLLPAALIGLPLPLGPLALGIGAAGIKVAIMTRILRYLSSVMRNRGGSQRGISVRKEFVHIPAKTLQRAVSPVDFGPLGPKTLAHAPLNAPRFQPYGFAGGLPPAAFARDPVSPFEVPVPHRVVFPQSPQFSSSPPSFHFVFPPPPPAVQYAPTRTLSPDDVLRGGQPVTGGSFDQLLRIAQSPAVSTIVSQNPDLVVKFIQGIAGAKPRHTPIGTAHSTAGLTGSKIGGGDIEALLNFVRQDPNLVRNIVRADPEFVPSLVNNILGIPGRGAQEPTPAPPGNFSGFDFKQPNNETKGEKFSEVPANVPIESEQAKITDLLSEAPKTAAKPPISPRTSYTFQRFPQAYYTLPNYGPSPYDNYGFPAGFGEPLRLSGFSGAPWRITTPLRVKNLPTLTDYQSFASGLKYGSGDALLKKEQSTTVQKSGSVQKDKPETAPTAAVSTEEPVKPPVDAYGSVRKGVPKTSLKTTTTTERPAVLQSYESVQKQKPKPTPATVAVTARPSTQPAVQAKAKPESLSQKEQPKQPAIRTSKPTQAKPSYTSEVVKKVPALQRYGPSSRNDKPKLAYTASSSGQVATLVKSADVAAEKPVVEQDLPVAKETKGDVYTSVGQGRQNSADGSDRPADTKAAAPPPVRPVFMPVTGKFRSDKNAKGGPEENVGSFPAILFDQTAFEGQDSENSHTGGPVKTRARRDTSIPATSIVNLDSIRTMDNRKCVFKMVCFIGANDHTLGRVGDGVTLIIRYMDNIMTSSEAVADYNRAYEVGRTHGGEGCRIKYNTCPMTVIDLVSLSANLG
ncbi:hypothetical protein HPB50_015875 [Hyalomma asiaticum]|uniref:Uncharacterized protein n=1 Tax=Hyalomma asiaticum TaxID=266040 RepID=A0ACB7RVJ8_HYAAI|nr:hypothetical protein HPB50_015875 [Hyalomma asiaticum]